MSFRNFFISLLLLLCYLQPLHAWGERGHHAISIESANRLYETSILSKDVNEKIMARFFKRVRFQLSHISNIPDVSWRDDSKKIRSANSPTHFFRPEVLFNAPWRDSDQVEKYISLVRKIPPSYSDVLSRFQAKKVKVGERPIRIFSDLGTAPWRAQQFFNLLVDAFKCVSIKDEESKKSKTPKSNLHTSYKCDSDRSRSQDLSAAIEFAGLLSHFVADLSQPLHVTTRHDGQPSNKGIHYFFENNILNHLDESLEADLLRASLNVDDTIAFVKKRLTLSKSLSSIFEEPNGVALVMIQLAADSIGQISVLEGLDNTYAWNKPRKAKRKFADDENLHKNFRPFVLNRLTASTIILSELWKSAWELGDRPRLNLFDKKKGEIEFLPYPVNVSFIQPDYDLAASKASYRTFSEKESAEDAPVK